MEYENNYGFVFMQPSCFKIFLSIWNVKGPVYLTSNISKRLKGFMLHSGSDILIFPSERKEEDKLTVGITFLFSGRILLIISSYRSHILSLRHTIKINFLCCLERTPNVVFQKIFVDWRFIPIILSHFHKSLICLVAY